MRGTGLEVPDHIGHAGRRVTGRVQGPQLQAADHKCVTVIEQKVKLATVSGKFGACIKDITKDLLHRRNVRADDQLTAQLFLKVMSRRKVISMHMRLQQPLHFKPQRAHARYQMFGTGGSSSARLGIIVKHTVDQCTLQGLRIPHDVAESESGRIKQRFNMKAGSRHETTL